jgi:hypothetical protein
LHLEKLIDPTKDEGRRFGALAFVLRPSSLVRVQVFVGLLPGD